MELKSTMDLHFGGAGSGCHGDNCGRPAGHGGPHGPKNVSDVMEKHGYKNTGLQQGYSIYKLGTSEISIGKDMKWTVRDTTIGTRTGKGPGELDRVLEERKSKAATAK